MKKLCCHLPFFCMAFTAMLLFVLASCSKKQVRHRNIQQIDSLFSEAYHQRDYDRLLELSDSSDVSAIKAEYWRGYAYSRQQKPKLAEHCWKKAVELPINNDEDLNYYAKSANRLAGVLMLKDDYEGTLKIIIPTIKAMEEAGHNDESDFAYMLITMGCCQLKMGNEHAAEKNLEKATVKYNQIISMSHDIQDYNSAIAGVVTIVDTYLQLQRYEEALQWIGTFNNLMEQYARRSDASSEILDKQQARQNLYRACALEGLSLHKEASTAYDSAQVTNYAKTDEGLLEATRYLMLANRMDEAARNFEVLDRQIMQHGMKYSLENISHYVLPKLRSNLAAGRKDSALAIAKRITEVLDTAITLKQRDDAAELAVIYNTQQQETEFAEQSAELSRQRFQGTTIALVLVIFCSLMIIYFRHNASIRLERAFQQLEVANARAEESSRMKSAFIRQISHEIRTPLNVLSGFTQIITSPNVQLDDKTKQDVSRNIVEHTNRITGLVNKMLELSEASSRTIIDRTDKASVRQIALQASEDSGVTRASHITFEEKMADEVRDVELTTNLHQATRALSLILDNAQKYTKEGAVRLTVKKGEREVSFIIEDTGIGVPAAEAEHIFEEFVQLDEYNVGTGIGLTVARSICRRLGGDIVLDTSYTGGSRFVMTLPITEENLSEL